MKIPFRDKEYDAAVWKPAVGRIGDNFAYDTETTVETDPTVVPDYVIGTAFTGHTLYFLRRQDLAMFWDIHKACVVYVHTASFDLEVTTKACGFNFHSMIEVGLIRDVSIYYRLLKCATTGDVPHKSNLALMCCEYLGVELDKDDTVRLDFGRFYHDGHVDYASIPSGHLVYAGLDAIATFQLAEVLEPQCRSTHERYTPPPQVGTVGTAGRSAQSWGLLSHDIQIFGDIALRAIEHYGIHVDAAAVDVLDQKLAASSGRHHTVLATYGYVSGTKGNQAVFDQIIRRIEGERGIVLPVTPKTQQRSKAAADLEPIADHPFVAAFLGAQETDKLRKTYVDKLRVPGGVVRPHYTLIVRTGRTSCSAPNIQNQPRKGGIRECFLPAPGHVFITCDYSGLELCTLAHITHARYGTSAMRDLINQGVDLHRLLASKILGKSIDQVTKDERQKAKAVNFGLPGGMGNDGLRAYADSSYGVELSADEVENWRAAWLGLFPEMQQYLAHGDDRERLGTTLDLDSYPNQYPGFIPEIAASIVLRVAGGAISTSAGRSFSSAELDWAWQQIADSRAGLRKELAADILVRKGSRELQQAITPGQTVSIPAGRVRANCSFTESRNWPFQSLAADGAKLALYALIRAKYRVVAFIHDEVLVEVSEMDDYLPAAEDISKIMVNAMQMVCPDVAIRTEHAVMRRWRKDAKAVCDAQGRLIPFEDAPAEKTKQCGTPCADHQA
jgi:hypothetical protein